MFFLELQNEISGKQKQFTLIANYHGNYVKSCISKL